MKRSFIPLLLAVFVLASSCATMEERPGATTGAVVGAGAGAVIGGMTKGTQGAVIGAIIGGIVGGAVGHYAYDTKRTQAQTNNTYNYRDTASSARIESVGVEPKRVRPGAKLDTKLTYAVLTQSAGAVNVREVREIWRGETVIANPEITNDRRGGTYESNLPVFLPNDLAKGTYKVRYTVQTDFSKDTRETTFVVY